jgi:hypothetical protein
VTDVRRSTSMISSDLSRREDNSTSSWDIASPRITPPGTPPPPYGNTSGEITLHGTDFNGIGHVSLWLLAKKFTLNLINFNFFFSWMHHIPDQLLAWRMTTCPTKKWSVELSGKTWVLKIYFLAEST